MKPIWRMRRSKNIWAGFDDSIISTHSSKNISEQDIRYICYDTIVIDHVGFMNNIHNKINFLGRGLSYYGRKCLSMDMIKLKTIKC